MTAAIDDLRTVARYQFGPDAGDALFPQAESLDVTRTSSGRPRQIHTDDGRIATYERDGRFRLGIAGGERLDSSLPADAYRVVVDDESEPFVREGRNVFAKFVVRADETIRPRDEVLVVHEDGRLLGVGRAELSGEGMLAFETGMAVKTREGIDS
ncbi:PUA domain-containing protein [Halovenus salina]|uniref:PUA domain-containing protein n=1 Tax=Halovenus salina TaxID=1510225 RepID=UPI002260AA3A|nr:PUA domain-containing protein [Halovenus salina]